MSDHHRFRLSDARRIQPLLPDKVCGVPRVETGASSPASYVIHNGLGWRDAPPGYGPTLYNRFVRWPASSPASSRLWPPRAGRRGR